MGEKIAPLHFRSSFLKHLQPYTGSTVRRLQAASRLDDISQCYPHYQRKSGHDFEIQYRLTPNPAYLFHIPHASYSQYDGQKYDRGDQHLDHVNKLIADLMCGRAKTFKIQTDNHAQDNGQDDLKS